MRLNFAIRPYRDDDESRVLELLDASLGGGPGGIRPPEFFRWKHFENPFGRSFMLVADREGRIIGLRAFMRWEFVAKGITLRAVSAVDTATHPDYQGHGVFSSLTQAALEAVRGDTDLVFNTPNEKSLPGYLKMGWEKVGRMPILLKVRRPVRFLFAVPSLRRPTPPTRTRSKEAMSPAGDVLLEEAEEIGRLAEAQDEDGGRLRTSR